jgi:hypothetical protein
MPGSIGEEDEMTDPEFGVAALVPSARRFRPDRGIEDYINDEGIRQGIAARLDPDRFGAGAPSNVYWAFLGRLLGEDCVQPFLETDVISPDGFILSGFKDSKGERMVTVAAFEQSIRGIGEVVHLTPYEIDWMIARIPSRFAPDRRALA